MRRFLFLPVAALLAACGSQDPSLTEVWDPHLQPVESIDFPAALRLHDRELLFHAIDGPVRLEPTEAPAEFAGERIAAFHAGDTELTLLTRGTVLARFTPDLVEEEVQHRAELAGASIARHLPGGLGLYALDVGDPLQAVFVARRLHESGWAVWATPSFLRPIWQRYTPNDSYVNDEWHLDNIQARSAWDQTLGSTQVRIAIIDSGMDMGHEDLAGKVVDPYDAMTGDNDPTADSQSPHGTACAGLATAITDNNRGVAGVCPHCRLMPIRIISKSSAFVDDQAVASAFVWAADHGATIVSNSWGFAGGMSIPQAVDEAMHYAANAGSLLLFASGNDGRSIQTYEIGAHMRAVTVGATDWNDLRFDYSNYGPELQLAAPAGAVTTDLGGSAGYDSGDYTDRFGGTSAATPVVAGAAGLVQSAAPSLTPEQLVTVLGSTADQVGHDPYPGGRNESYGYGRINLAEALDMLSLGSGRACSVSAECGPAGQCLQPLGGKCTLACTTDADCPNELTCAQLDGAARSCLRPCAHRNACDDSQTCWPATDGGACWTACTSDAECNGEPCNPLGLCGELEPPAIVDPVDGCLCDTTFDCDADCTCDLECPLVGSGPLTCSGGPSGTWLAGLVLMAVRLRRRRA